ncbi:hypothetical protein [Thiobacillus sp.]
MNTSDTHTFEHSHLEKWLEATRLLGWLSQGSDARIRRRVQKVIDRFESRLCRMITQARQQGDIRADIKEKLTMTPSTQAHGFSIRVLSLLAIGFGLLTIKEGGTILFGDEAARAAAGHYVPFVLWFNFLAGFVYVVAGAGLWLRQRWAVWLAAAIALATAITFAAFGVHVASGGAYELRTVIAMSMRTLVWVVIAAIAWRRLPRTNQPLPS